MKTHIKLGLALIMAIAIVPSDSFGRGFGGFHGGGFGGGGFRAGGFSGGGFRAGGFDSGGFRSGGLESGGFRSSDFGGARAGGFDSGGLAGGFRASDYGGALSRSSLGSFLGLPTDGGFQAASGAVGARGAAASPYGFAAGSAGATGHVYQGPNGTTVAHGTAGARGIAGGPGGVAGGGAFASGTAIKGPNGNVYTHGTAAARGFAAGPNGAVAGRGFAAGSSATGAFGHYSATSMHSQGMACQHWCDHSGVFTASWCGAHPWGWCPHGYTAAAWAAAAWRPLAWASAGAIIGADVAPAAYDYGDNIIYQNGDVYYGDQSIGTQQQYYQEADNLANSGGNANPPDNADWMPLGVFGLMAQGQKVPEMIFQLAVDKQGTLRGNYYDQIADSTVPVHGAVNKQNQRVAWHVGKNTSMVIETGLYNLTKDQSTALVHLGPDSTEQFVMVRMKQPSSSEPASGEQAPPPPAP